MGNVAKLSATRELSRDPHEFSDWDELQSKQDEYCGVWIAGSLNNDIDRLARKIRESPSWYKLIFSELPSDSPYVDRVCTFGQTPSLAGRFEYLSKASRVVPEALSPTERLLFFMYLRDDYKLEPHYRRTEKGLYVYPVANSLEGDTADSEWFARLTRSHLLTPARLVDRIRKCRRCGSAHLSYVEVCPACSSIQVTSSPSLHCFGCGHVGAKSDFDAASVLRCPRCEARLRHIGVDYDLAAEQFACQECHALSMQTPVVGRCFDCGAKADPQQLEVAEIYSYTINRNSIEALRRREACGPDCFERAGFVLSDQFRQMLDWSSGTQRRYGELEFSLLLLDFTNIDALIVHYDAQSLLNMFEEFGVRLRQHLRGTDVLSVDGDERIWILQPRSQPEVTQRRLLELADQIRPVAGPALSLRVRSFQAKRDMTPEDDSGSIMQKLLGSEA